MHKNVLNNHKIARQNVDPLYILGSDRPSSLNAPQSDLDNITHRPVRSSLYKMWLFMTRHCCLTYGSCWLISQYFCLQWFSLLKCQERPQSICRPSNAGNRLTVETACATDDAVVAVAYTAW